MKGLGHLILQGKEEGLIVAVGREGWVAYQGEN